MEKNAHYSGNCATDQPQFDGRSSQGPHQDDRIDTTAMIGGATNSQYSCKHTDPTPGVHLNTPTSSEENDDEDGSPQLDSGYRNHARNHNLREAALEINNGNRNNLESDSRRMSYKDSNLLMLNTRAKMFRIANFVGIVPLVFLLPTTFISIFALDKILNRRFIHISFDTAHNTFGAFTALISIIACIAIACIASCAARDSRNLLRERNRIATKQMRNLICLGCATIGIISAAALVVDLMQIIRSTGALQLSEEVFMAFTIGAFCASLILITGFVAIRYLIDTHLSTATEDMGQCTPEQSDDPQPGNLAELSFGASTWNVSRAGESQGLQGGRRGSNNLDLDPGSRMQSRRQSIDTSGLNLEDERQHPPSSILKKHTTHTADPRGSTHSAITDL